MLIRTKRTFEEENDRKLRRVDDIALGSTIRFHVDIYRQHYMSMPTSYFQLLDSNATTLIYRYAYRGMSNYCITCTQYVPECRYKIYTNKMAFSYCFTCRIMLNMSDKQCKTLIEHARLKPVLLHWLKHAYDKCKYDFIGECFLWDRKLTLGKAIRFAQSRPLSSVK